MGGVVTDHEEPGNDQGHHDLECGDGEQVAYQDEDDEQRHVHGDVPEEVGHAPPGRVVVHRVG